MAITNYLQTMDGVPLRFDATTSDGYPITVNVGSVAYFGDDDGHCVIAFSGGAHVRLQESADEVRRVINLEELRATMRASH